MWLGQLWSWARGHKGLAAIFAALLLGASVSAWSAYRFRSAAIEAKKEIQAKEQEVTVLAKEGEIQREAWKRSMGTTETRLAQAQGEIRTLKALLGKIEAQRRELFDPPAIDNLAARFDRALEGLK